MDAGKVRAVKGKAAPGGVKNFVTSLYTDPSKWQLVKHSMIFLVGVMIAREFSDVDLMAPPPGVQ